MKKDIRIKISNNDGSVKQSTLHEIFLLSSVDELDPQITEIVQQAIKKFKSTGEEPDEVIITESYFYG